MQATAELLTKLKKESKHIAEEVSEQVAKKEAARMA
jgi:hypothetical protein